MSKEEPHTILLGGIGGDSHSVGLNILRQSLSQNYRLFYLGTQNKLEVFFKYAPLCNIAMISCMDGHARRYLREFSEMITAMPARHVKWYLGGNLTIGEGFGYERIFTELGFARVFPKYVDLKAVLEFIERDLHETPPVRGNAELWEKTKPVHFDSFEHQSEHKLDRRELEQMRKGVLETWKTGVGAKDLDRNAAFLKDRPSFPAEQRKVLHGESSMLVQPRCGVALVNEQIDLFKAYRDAGAHTLSYQVDSYTRNNNYATAEEEIRHSTLFESSINGFPVINHGVPALKRIITEVNRPLQTRHSTREPKLLAEISYAGGVTSFEGGAICYNVPYYSDYPLSQSIPAWQYVDRLTGLYYENYGIVLDREYFGTLTATLIPPCLAIATGILESLLAVQQGVRCVSIGYAEQGNRVQDIAAIGVIKALGKEIIQRAGYEGVQVNAVFHQYMAAFPPLPHLAENLIHESAVTAAMSGATRLITKTPVEAYKIPTMRDNLEGLQLNFAGVRSAKGAIIDDQLVSREAEIIQDEVQSIIDGVISCGKGNVASGIVTAFQQGVLDIPFAPSVHNKGDVVTARDVDGAVRFLRPGKLPFGRELRELHDDKMGERLHAEGLARGRDDNVLVERDVLSIARGQYETWPLSK